MLEAAGVEFEVQPPDSTRQRSRRRMTATRQSLAIATGCGQGGRGQRASPGDWVIGSDSLVSVDGAIFASRAIASEAAEHLRAFSGRPMVLTSAVALARDGEVDWSHVQSATLDVRTLSDAFIESYLDMEWPEVGYCVGVFRMEGRGVQLFERVEGDHFAILGMPLLPLLGALRARGLMPS